LKTVHAREKSMKIFSGCTCGFSLQNAKGIPHGRSLEVLLNVNGA
jgi:hypothetical protein